jgi:hypothetical protein
MRRERDARHDGSYQLHYGLEEEARLPREPPMRRTVGDRLVHCLREVQGRMRGEPDEESGPASLTPNHALWIGRRL